MRNREFVQLAHEYDPKKHKLGGSYISEKLDGQRCLWDGGITRNVPLKEIPWANVDKLDRYVDTDQYGTGLWTRYGHPIFAPEWWVDGLPRVPLDGELYMGLKTFQSLMSATRKLTPIDDEWRHIEYMVFDGPSYKEIFEDGRINNPHYHKIIAGSDFADFVVKFGLKLPVIMSRSFDSRLPILEGYLRGCKTGVLHTQLQLSYNNDIALATMLQTLEDVLAKGGEGLIARQPHSYWEPRRMNHIVKIKRRHDAEATVLGYVAGEYGKIHGMIGALVVRGNAGVIFELGTGLSDVDRAIQDKEVRDMALSLPGRRLPPNYSHHLYPLGCRVTYAYREFTEDGVPKEGSFLRRADL